MKKLRWLFVSVVPMVALTLAAGGCGGDTKKDDKGAKPAAGGSADKKADADKSAPPAAGEMEAVAAKGVGVLKGKITFDGDPPARGDLTERMKEQGDKDHCLKGDTKDPAWIVGPDKGIQNVVVWVRAPKGKFFQLSDDQKKSTATVSIDQPFCLFEPHVVTFNPSYYDGKEKKQVPTGQKLKVLNSAPIGHNTSWEGQNKVLNPGKNEKINPKAEMDIPAKPSTEKQAGREDLITLRCDLHKWMNAYAWVLDHPFSAVTKPDGTYEIKGIPAGSEVEVVYWHESMGAKPKTEKITLKDGDNDFSTKIKN